MAKKSQSRRASIIPRLVRLLKPLPRPFVLALRPGFGGALRVCGGRRKVEDAMRAALGEVPVGAVDRYFARIGDSAAYALLIQARGYEASGVEAFCAAAPGAQEIFDETLARGRGAILAVPHLNGQEAFAGFVARRGRVALMARRAPDPSYQEFKERWYQSLGVQVVWRPGRGAKWGGLQDAAGALRVLRKNYGLLITPDLIRAPGTGVSVRLFGRTVEIPEGPFFLSVRTGAPLLPSFYRYVDGRYVMWLDPPLAVQEGDPAAAIAAQAQEWTTRFEDFVRRYPEMWQFWLDKRWSRWLLETPASCG